MILLLPAFHSCDNNCTNYNKQLWSVMFVLLPNTNTLISYYSITEVDWDFSQVVSVPIIESLNPRPPFLPQAIPSEFADKLLSFHGHPFVWFAGQFLTYLMRPNKELRDFIAEKKKALKIKKPYVRYICMYVYVCMPRHYMLTDRKIVYI